MRYNIINEYKNQCR